MKNIVKRIVLLRHSKKNGRVLSKEGHEYARHIGKDVLSGHSFNLVIPSLYVRAIETAVSLLSGMNNWCGGEDGMAIQPCNVIGPTMETWISHLDHGENITAMERTYPEFMREAYTQLDRIFNEIIGRTKEGETTLVITHSPCLEATVRALTCTTKNPHGELIAEPIGYCEGVVLAIWNDGTITVEEEIRHAE